VPKSFFFLYICLSDTYVHSVNFLNNTLCIFFQHLTNIILLSFCHSIFYILCLAYIHVLNISAIFKIDAIILFGTNAKFHGLDIKTLYQAMASLIKNFMNLHLVLTSFIKKLNHCTSISFNIY